MVRPPPHFQRYFEQKGIEQDQDSWAPEIQAYGIISDAVFGAKQSGYIIMAGTMQNIVFT